MWMSYIITITNNNGDCASSWKNPLRIFSAKIFSSRCLFHSPGFHYYYYYYYYYYLLFWSFSHQNYLMVLHWSLSDSKSLQVSSILHSILAVLSNAIICIVSTRPPTSMSSRPFNNPLVIAPKVRITIGKIVTFMVPIFFFNSLSWSRYLSFFPHSFRFILWSAGTAKSTILQISDFIFFC